MFRQHQAQLHADLLALLAQTARPVLRAQLELV
jgi:hypothetical protein